MFKLAYVSHAAPDLTDEEIQRIVERSQLKNARVGITGFLCLRGRTFLQYLEGGELSVVELMDTIRNDPRHEVIKTVVLGNQDQRNFLGWQMQFLDDSFFGQVALEDVLEGVLREFGRGVVEEARARAMADRLVGRIAIGRALLSRRDGIH